MEEMEKSVQLPGTMTLLKRAYQTVSEHVYLVFFPLILDLLLLLAPKIKISTSVGNEVITLPTIQLADNLLTQWEVMKDHLLHAIGNFTLTSFLRTNPLGIPSLFSNRLFETGLIKNIPAIEITEKKEIILIAALFMLLGIIATTFFYKSNFLALNLLEIGKPWEKILENVLNFVGLLFVFAGFFLLLFLPGMIFVGLLTVFSPNLGIISYVTLLLIILILTVSLFFAPHSVVMHNQSIIAAMKHSSKVIAPIRLNATIFLAFILGISYVTNLFWNLPKDGSWFLLIGAFGHAVVSTILIVASFHYFAEAELFLSKKEISVK